MLREALRLRLQSPARRRESWPWSLEAPAFALLLYSIGVVIAQDLGIFGFFVPGMLVAVGMLTCGLAWVVGRTCSIARPPRRYPAMLAAALVSVLIVPIGIRAAEDIWAQRLLMNREAVAFQFPGIRVASNFDTTSPRREPGLIFSNVVRGAGGRTLTLRHHRQHSAPPYLAIGGFLAATVAFVSRRRAVS